MNYYCFVLIDNGDDFYAEIRDSTYRLVQTHLTRKDVEDLGTFAKNNEIALDNPEAVIHAVDAQSISVALKIETGEAIPIAAINPKIIR